MTETQLAYAAGIIDGEGYIGINKKYSKTHSSGYQYHIRIDVTMTDFCIPIWLQSQFGGSVYIHKGINKPDMRWNITCRDAEKFLIAILPFLIVKKKQAELALQFQSRRLRGRPCRRDGKGRFLPGMVYSDAKQDEADKLLMQALKDIPVMNHGI